MPRVFTSSLIQQIVITILGILKIRLLFASHSVEFVGHFFVLAGLFYICMIVFDSTRKGILTREGNLSSFNSREILKIALTNSIILLCIECGFSLFVTYFVSPKTPGTALSLLVISLIVQVQAVSTISLALYTLTSGFAKANLLVTALAILFFPFFAISCKYLDLSGILFANFAANMAPGIVAIPIIFKAKIVNTMANNQPDSNRYWKFRLIQFSENTANSLNSPMIGSRLGLSAVGEYSVMSKFALLYDFVPIALFPFMIKNQNILIRKKSFNLQLLLWTNAIIITIFSLLFYYPIISFLSDNKLKNPIISVLPYLLAGSIVSITSYPIQRSVSDSILGLRARVSIWMLATNISMTWIFLPIFGASVAYTMTGFTTALYAGILARYNTNQIRQEGTDEP